MKCLRCYEVEVPSDYPHFMRECDKCYQKETTFRNRHEIFKLKGNHRRFSGPDDYTWEEKIALTIAAHGVDYVAGRKDRPRIRSGWMINARLEDVARRRRNEVVYRIESVPLPTYRPQGKTRSRVKMGKAREILSVITECSYCGLTGDRDTGPDGKTWHIDHIIPISKTGTNELDNLCKACATCNVKKGDRLVAVREGAVTAQDVLDGALENLRTSA